LRLVRNSDETEYPWALTPYNFIELAGKGIETSTAIFCVSGTAREHMTKWRGSLCVSGIESEHMTKWMGKLVRVETRRRTHDRMYEERERDFCIFFSRVERVFFRSRTQPVWSTRGYDGGASSGIFCPMWDWYLTNVCVVSERVVIPLRGVICVLSPFPVLRSASKRS